MQSIYHFSVQNDFLGNTTILFKEITRTTEFLKMILHILGMYNFILNARLDIWHNNQICAALDAPNGTIFISIDAQKNISLTASKNQNDILNLKKILDKFYVFKKKKLEIDVFAAAI